MLMSYFQMSIFKSQTVIRDFWDVLMRVFFCKKGYLLSWFVPSGNVMQWRPVWSLWLTHLGLIWVPSGIYSQLTLNRIGSHRVFLIHRLHQTLRPCSTMHVQVILIQRLLGHKWERFNLLLWLCWPWSRPLETNIKYHYHDFADLMECSLLWL